MGKQENAPGAGANSFRSLTEPVVKDCNEEKEHPPCEYAQDWTKRL
jgi:hypothetical protein